MISTLHNSYNFNFHTNFKKVCEASLLTENTTWLEDQYILKVKDLLRLEDVLKSFNKHAQQGVRPIFYKKVENIIPINIEVSSYYFSIDKLEYTDIFIFGTTEYVKFYSELSKIEINKVDILHIPKEDESLIKYFHLLVEDTVEYEINGYGYD